MQADKPRFVFYDRDGEEWTLPLEEPFLRRIDAIVSDPANGFRNVTEFIRDALRHEAEVYEVYREARS